MAQKEEEKFQRGELMKGVLRGIAVGLVIGAVFTMPGLLLALKPFFGNKKVSKQSLQKTYKALVRKKLVQLKEEKGQFLLKITEGGRKFQKKFELQDSMKAIKLSPPKTWDRKWRLLVFDIPEPKKEAREALRDLLTYLGFYRFQDSVFIYPFPCEHEVDLLKELFGIQKYVHCFSVLDAEVPSEIAYHFSPLLNKYL